MNVKFHVMDLAKACLCLTVVLSLFRGIESQILQGNATSLPNNGICYSVDVRNHPGNFEKLRNCSVILGYLQIVLMSGKYDYSRYVFPQLREVTQFVLVYRIESMLSFGHLFPNLALIRGQRLFNNYALVIFEMPQLQEIGPPSLMTIQRGHVRIDQNPKLCYVKTVNWESITGKSRGHFLGDNGDEFCPDVDQACQSCESKSCWNAKTCQQYPVKNCHSECLGGCDDKGFCYRCKNYTDNGICVSKCPSDKYIEPGSNQCVTKNECLALYRGRGWIFENQCIIFCPIGYRQIHKNGTKTCLFCGHECNNVCIGSEINHFEQVQSYKGCHYVKGSLHIRMLGEFSHANDVMAELEDSLGGIREISGHLEVTRTNAITSLDFLRNLTLIKGETLLHNRYAISVLDMTNLLGTWDWSTKKNLTIGNGTLFFHENPRLCMKEITKLASITNVIIGDHDVCITSNGYKESCHQITLKAEVKEMGKTHAVLSWERFIRDISDVDMSEDIGYSLYYLPNAKEGTTSHYGIVSCRGDNWLMKFIPEEDSQDPMVVYNLTHLEPGLNYAFYVQTYNIFRDREDSTKSLHKDGSDAKSDIMFFQTKMNRPPMPLLLEAVSYTDDSLTIYWTMSPLYKGNVSKYIVELFIVEDEFEHYDRVDYCENNHDIIRVAPKKAPRYNVPKIVRPPIECDCEKWNKEMQTLIDRFNMENKESAYDCDVVLDPNVLGSYEDLLRGIRCGHIDLSNLGAEYAKAEDLDVYNETHKRSKRDVGGHFDIQEMLDLRPKKFDRKVFANVTVNDRYHRFSTNFSSVHKNFTINKLKNYSKYVILLAGCIETDTDDCGWAAIAAHRTLNSTIGDTILDFGLKKMTSNVAQIKWDAPLEPNGIILNYRVEYKRKDVDDYVPRQVCLSRMDHERNDGRYLLKDLVPGVYLIRIRAVTVGDFGPWTEWKKVDLTFFTALVIVGIICGAGVLSYAATYWVYRTRSKIRQPDDMDVLVGPNANDNDEMQLNRQYQVRPPRDPIQPFESHFGRSPKVSVEMSARSKQGSELKDMLLPMDSLDQSSTSTYRDLIASALSLEEQSSPSSSQFICASDLASHYRDMMHFPQQPRGQRGRSRRYPTVEVFQMDTMDVPSDYENSDEDQLQ